MRAAACGDLVAELIARDRLHEAAFDADSDDQAAEALRVLRALIDSVDAASALLAAVDQAALPREQLEALATALQCAGPAPLMVCTDYPAPSGEGDALRWVARLGRSALTIEAAERIGVDGACEALNETECSALAEDIEANFRRQPEACGARRVFTAGWD